MAHCSTVFHLEDSIPYARSSGYHIAVLGMLEVTHEVSYSIYVDFTVFAWCAVASVGAALGGDMPHRG
jgi:hypothetical protein